MMRLDIDNHDDHDFSHKRNINYLNSNTPLAHITHTINSDNTMECRDDDDLYCDPRQKEYQEDDQNMPPPLMPLLIDDDNASLPPLMPISLSDNNRLLPSSKKKKCKILLRPQQHTIVEKILQKIDLN